MSNPNFESIKDADVLQNNYNTEPYGRVKEESKTGKKRGPKKKYEASKVTFMLETVLDEALDEFCFNVRISKSQLVRTILRRHLKLKGYKIFDEVKEKDSRSVMEEISNNS